MAKIEGSDTRNMPEARKSASQAGYVELIDAKKDADCSEVNVPGGISRERGCCNLYQAESADTTSFKCGVCEYVRPK